MGEHDATIFGMGIFAILFLATIQLVSTSTGEGLENVERQMFLMNCPPPFYDAKWNGTNVTIEGYNVVFNMSAVDFGGEGTVIRCLLTPNTPFPNFQVILSNKDYQATTLGFPTGGVSYFLDSMGSFFQRINNFFFLVGFYVNPASFDILGYGFEDLSGLFLAMVILMYAMCYIAVGVMVYKIVSPFAGVG